MTRLTFSLLTSANDLTKRFAFDHGQIVKTSAAQMTQGTIETVTVEGLEGLSRTIRTMTSQQALIFGILVNGRTQAQVVTQTHLEEARRKAIDAEAVVARTREYINFAYQPGVLMGDHDRFKDQVLSQDELRDRLIAACPGLAGVTMLWKPSSSYGIQATHDPTIAIKGGGQRFYFPILSAADIPEAGRNLNLLLWAAGFGWIEPSKSGQALKRTLLDDSVYQPERLDFAGPVILGQGVRRVAPEPSIIDGRDCLTLKDLAVNGDIRERAQRAMAAAICSAQSKLRAVREQWIEQQAPELAQRNSIPIEHAHACLSRASESCELAGDFLLHPHHGEPVTVKEVLDNPGAWHGTRFADPLEPEYGQDPRIAWANLRTGGVPFIHSHAHGGIRYVLIRPLVRILVAVGERARITSETEAVIKERGEIYNYGDGGTAKITDSRIRPVVPDWLADYLDRHASFYARTSNPDGGVVERPKDAPPYLQKRILSRVGERGFPRLEGLVTAPTLRRDGSILDTPGYDVTSGLLYVSPTPNPPKVLVAPNIQDAFRALALLWKPFRDFPFVNDASRTVMVSALLSGILRASLPTCPGHAFDAPTAGTGKTLLAECVGIIATGERPAIMAPTDDDTEIRKRLFSILREGGGVILWDNISGPLGGDALDAFLTAETFRERVLGVSESETLPNRALLLVTGNNISTRGDTFRRVVKARLDAQLEAPYLRAFSLNPREYCLAHRQEMVVAALTIVRAWFVAGCKQEAEGNTASFEDWDRLVRQPLALLAKYDCAWGNDDTPSLCDVAEVFHEAATEAPHKENLRAVLHAWDKSTKYGTGKRLCARDFRPNVAEGFTNEPADESNPLELAAAFADAVRTHGKRIDTTALGYWLKKHAGERIDRLWFKRDGESNGSAAYVLRREGS